MTRVVLKLLPAAQWRALRNRAVLALHDGLDRFADAEIGALLGLHPDTVTRIVRKHQRAMRVWHDENVARARASVEAEIAANTREISAAEARALAQAGKVHASPALRPQAQEEQP